jgi:hypothetical protein
MVAVIGLPYGRVDYNAFAETYHGPEFLGGTYHVAVDCDVTSSTTEDGTGGTCEYPLPGTVSVAVDVTLGNSSGGDLVLGAFNFNLINPDNTQLLGDVVACAVPPYLNCNPDFSESGLPGAAWSCGLPAPDEDIDGSGTTETAFISCLNGGDPPTLADSTTHYDMARVTYDVAGGAVPGAIPLALDTVNAFDSDGNEVIACFPPDPAPCVNGTVNLVPPPPPTSTPTTGPTLTPTPIPPTATPTNSPTATATLAGYGVVKVPESCIESPIPADVELPPSGGDEDNCVYGNPSAANLWICESGPCDGEGEGELKVYEVAENIPNTADPPAEPGLAAYEFSVEYDNFVIKSLNPCDFVFGDNGANTDGEGADRGNVNELDSSGALNSDCADDTGGDGPGPQNNNGSCAFSAILENIIHFGCVTADDPPDNLYPGPTGDAIIASLVLVPHEDLSNDLFPGNDNGVVTIIKDNGCELVDHLGHPLPGDVGGGLTAYCADLVVTVRILEGDIDLDCEVDVDDAQAIAGHYGAFFGSLLYSKWLDLEPNLHDLDIDIKDIQKVFGRIGSTCQDPVPDQLPVQDFSPNS